MAKKSAATQLSIKPTKVINGRYYFTEGEDVFRLPPLIEIQLNSYQWFLTDGLKELLEEVSPINDFSGKKMELHFLNHTLDKKNMMRQQLNAKIFLLKLLLRLMSNLSIRKAGK